MVGSSTGVSLDLLIVVIEAEDALCVCVFPLEHATLFLFGKLSSNADLYVCATIDAAVRMNQLQQ